MIVLVVGLGVGILDGAASAVCGGPVIARAMNGRRSCRLQRDRSRSRADGVEECLGQVLRRISNQLWVSLDLVRDFGLTCLCALQRVVMLSDVMNSWRHAPSCCCSAAVSCCIFAIFWLIIRPRILSSLRYASCACSILARSAIVWVRSPGWAMIDLLVFVKL